MLLIQIVCLIIFFQSQAVASPYLSEELNTLSSLQGTFTSASQIAQDEFNEQEPIQKPNHNALVLRGVRDVFLMTGALFAIGYPNNLKYVEHPDGYGGTLRTPGFFLLNGLLTYPLTALEFFVSSFEEELWEHCLGRTLMFLMARQVTLYSLLYMTNTRGHWRPAGGHRRFN